MKLDRERVREGREQLALSIEDASTKARVSPHTWIRAERGEEIRPSSVRRIANALGLEPAELREEPDPKAIASSRRPSEKTAGAGQWDRVRKLSSQAKRGIRDYLKARGNKVSLKSPEGQRIKEGLIQAIKELDEGNPEIQEDRLESSNVLDRLEPISVLAFAQNAPPEVVADVLRDEDTQQVEASVMEGFVTVLLETVRTPDELFWQRLDDVGRAWRALSPSV